MLIFGRFKNQIQRQNNLNFRSIQAINNFRLRKLKEKNKKIKTQPKKTLK